MDALQRSRMGELDAVGVPLLRWAALLVRRIGLSRDPATSEWTVGSKCGAPVPLSRATPRSVYDMLLSQAYGPSTGESHWSRLLGDAAPEAAWPGR